MGRPCGSDFGGNFVLPVTEKVPEPTESAFHVVVILRKARKSGFGKLRVSDLVRNYSP